jgi:hypothetical protein
VKIREVVSQGEAYFVYPLGQLGAIGLNFDPRLHGEEMEVIPNPKFAVWETMPERHDLTTKLIFTIFIDRSLSIEQAFFFKEGTSSFPKDMCLFSHIRDNAKILIREVARTCVR